MKRNATKRALLMSVISLMLCLSMLVGTTFAWFTDEVRSAENIITAGNLDVEMFWAEGQKAVPTDPSGWTDASQGAIFNYTLWEPGYTQVRHVKIANVGTLALKYKVSILANGVIDDGTGVKLSDVIDVYYLPEATQIAGRTDLTNVPCLGSLTDVLAALGETGSGELEAGQSDVVTIALKMREDAGNAYMNKSIGTDFSVILNATQLVHEFDSFGDDYDADAVNPVLTGPVPVPDNGPMTVGDDDFNSTLPEDLVDELRGDGMENLYKSYSEPKIDVANKSIVIDEAKIVDQDGNEVDLEARGNDKPLTVNLYVGDAFAEGDLLKVYHDGEVVATPTVDAEGFVTYQVLHFCKIVVVENPLVSIERDGIGFESLQAAMAAAQDGDVLVLRAGYNTSDAPLTETITVSKKVTLVNGGMYLVSSAPATFTVVEGGKLTVTDGSFTIKNTAANGAAVLLDGGEFDMQGGSFDAHTAVRTTEGKSSEATLTAGWSNRVTVAFDSKGNDTINVLGGSIYSSAEAVKTVAGTHLTFNMSGGLLSSRTTQYSAAVNLQGTATVNMTGGKIENTYSSGYNGSSAIQVNVAPATINLSGTAALSSNGTAVMLGSHWSEPAVCEERIVFNMSGNAAINATSVMGFGIRYAQDCCDVTIAGSAKVNATFQAIQFNTNNYVYTNSTLLVAENATITSTAGRIGGGYAIASNGNVTITGGTITGSTAGIASFQAGAVVVVDNSQSGNPITINKVDIAEGVTYTVAGNPSIG